MCASNVYIYNTHEYFNSIVIYVMICIILASHKEEPTIWWWRNSSFSRHTT